MKRPEPNISLRLLSLLFKLENTSFVIDSLIQHSLISPRHVKSLNRLATWGHTPDLTIWLDIDPETGLKRAQDPNRFEAEGVSFQKKVRQGYLKSYGENKKRWLRIAVNEKSPEELLKIVMKNLSKAKRK
jgi:thymidylate kinase